jgi:hypothetical protein
MSRAKQLHWLILLITCMCQLTLAQDGRAPKSEFKTKPVKQKQLVVEYVYSFRELEFERPVQLTPLKSSSQASYVSPELAVLSHFSAMYAKDYQWFQNTWSRESQKLNSESDKKQNHTPQFWTDLWVKVLTDKRVELTHRIETGKYVLIIYRLVPTSGGPATFEDSLALTNEDGRWVLTQELANDPLLTYWNAPELRVRKTVR